MIGVPKNESNLFSGQGTENPLADTGSLDTLAQELIWDKLFSSFFLFLLHSP